MGGVQTETCEDCRKDIAGTPYLLENRILCKGCWQKRSWLASTPPQPTEHRTANSDVICANCDRKLGHLESAEVYRGKAVCAACYRLLAHTPIAQSYDSASAAPLQTYKVQSSLGTRKKKNMLTIILLCGGFFLVIVAGAILLTFWLSSQVGNFRRVELAENSRIAGTISNISNMKTALAIFETDTGRFPTTTEGLAALLKCPQGLDATWRGPYLEKMPVDKWGHDYIYRCPGTDDPTSYDLSSPGPDGKMGTSDDITKNAPL